MANWALCYAPKGESVALDMGTDEEVKFKNLEEKDSFLQRLQKGDQLFTEMGSGNDKICLAASQQEIKIFRLHSHELPKDIKRQKRVKLIAKISQEEPGLFYPFQQKNENLVQLRILVDAYETIQRGFRIPIQLRLQGIYQDLPLVGGEKFQKNLREQYAPENLIKVTLNFEKEIVKEIKILLKKFPVYQAVFEPIYGCGPLISARFIAFIQDIGRFETRGKLKNYAGFGFNNGEIQKRKKSQSIGWSPALKQAVFLFLDQVNRHDPEKDPWKQLLVSRKLYERNKFPEVVEFNYKSGEVKKLYTDGHIHSKALRHVGQKFLEWLWKKWRWFEGLGSDPDLPVSSG